MREVGCIVVDEARPRGAAAVADMAADIKAGRVERGGLCGSLEWQLAPWLGSGCLGGLRGGAENRQHSKSENEGRDGKADHPPAHTRSLAARKNRQQHRHGGRPRSARQFSLSSQRKTAPCARPARRKMTCSGRSPRSRVVTLLRLPKL